MRKNKKPEFAPSAEIDAELIATKLNFLLDEYKISTKILSEGTNISIPAINNLKRGDANPTIGTLNSISKFFGISLIEFLGVEGLSTIQKQTKIISLYDLRVADQRDEKDILNKMLIEIPKNINPDTLYGIVISNNALMPFYEKGTIFLITSSKNAVDGDIVLIRIQNNINSIKRVFIKKDLLYLKSLNMDESIEQYNKNDVLILGIVIQITQKII